MVSRMPYRERALVGIEDHIGGTKSTTTTHMTQRRALNSAAATAQYGVPTPLVQLSISCVPGYGRMCHLLLFLVAEKAHADLIGSEYEMHQATGDPHSIPKADRQL
jgi:hypothetical protein